MTQVCLALPSPWGSLVMLRHPGSWSPTWQPQAPSAWAPLSHRRGCPSSCNGLSLLPGRPRLSPAVGSWGCGVPQPAVFARAREGGLGQSRECRMGSRGGRLAVPAAQGPGSADELVRAWLRSAPEPQSGEGRKRKWTGGGAEACSGTDHRLLPLALILGGWAPGQEEDKEGGRSGRDPRAL